MLFFLRQDSKVPLRIGHAPFVPRAQVASGDFTCRVAAVDQVVKAESKDRNLIADLKDAIWLAGNSQISLGGHSPVQMTVKRLFVVGKLFVAATPKKRTQLETECAGLRVARVIEQQVIQKRHR